MSDLATIAFNATVPTSFIKDFFDGLVTLENARSARLERLLDEAGKTIATFFPPTVGGCCPVVGRSKIVQGTVLPKSSPVVQQTTCEVGVCFPEASPTSSEEQTSPQKETGSVLADVTSAFTEALAKCKSFQEGEVPSESAGKIEKLLHEGFASLPKVRVQGPSYSEDSGTTSTGFQIGGLGGFEDMIKAFQPMIDSFLGGSKKSETPQEATETSTETTTPSQ